MPSEKKRGGRHRGQTRRKPGPLYSEGARLLWGALNERRLETVVAADLAGVTNATVLRWLYGDRRPDLTSSLALSREFGIDPSLWLEAPKGKHARTLPEGVRAA